MDPASPAAVRQEQQSKEPSVLRMKEVIATIVLKGWHRVFMNTESLSRAMRHAAFLD